MLSGAGQRSPAHCCLLIVLRPPMWRLILRVVAVVAVDSVIFSKKQLPLGSWRCWGLKWSPPGVGPYYALCPASWVAAGNWQKRPWCSEWWSMNFASLSESLSKESWILGNENPYNSMLNSLIRDDEDEDYVCAFFFLKKLPWFCQYWCCFVTDGGRVADVGWCRLLITTVVKAGSMSMPAAELW